MAQYPMTQQQMVMHCMVLEQKINLSTYPMGAKNVDLQRFGDNTSPFYLVIITDYAAQNFQSFKINRLTGEWEVWDYGYS